MHRPGENAEEISSDTNIVGKETWSQFASKIRHGRRRIRVIDITTKMSYEYMMLKKLCRKRPFMRQWSVRDDFCNMSPGVVVMSPSMQAAFMKVFRLKDKSLIRRCLRDIIPIIEYRNREERQVTKDPAMMIPEGEADTLNQKKRELFERKEKGDNMKDMHLVDSSSQSKLRKKIRQRLIKFQRQLAVANAVASRTVLYTEDDAIGYFLFRGPAMYAGMHRVLFEVSKLMPHFVPRTMLDFGAGTGTSMMAAKEVYDAGSMAYPLYRSMRQTLTMNNSAQTTQLEELRYDLKRLERNNAEKKKARFLAVSALIEKGEIDLNDLPKDLAKEIVEVARTAAESKKERLAREKQARYHDVVDGTEWVDGDSTGQRSATTESTSDKVPGEAFGFDEAETRQEQPTSWWERFVESEVSAAQEKVANRLRPLQEIVAIEPSPGMMETGVMVVHDDIPNVTWKRYLMPEDETIQHDLVVAAYTLSEIAEPEQRTRIVQQLWKMTKGVLVLVEFANLSNFDMLMKARDTILAEKDVGLWDWQPTIVAPCPHEGKCPIRHSKVGVKKKRMRVCSTNVTYRSTFVEVWARHLPLKVSIEPISYLVFARNECLPQRAEARKAKIEAEERSEVMRREAKQRELYEASLSVKDVVFDRLSDEALANPSTGVPPPLPKLFAESASSALQESKGQEGQRDIPLQSIAGERRVVRTSDRRENWLVYPTSVPSPDHKFNRAFVDSGHQRTRAITPQEILTVRGEVSDTRSRFAKQFPKYHRVVGDPKCRGKVTADLCTTEGELIKGRVYRRFYGDENTQPLHSTLRWQHIGGWKLLRRVRKGSLFPNDVPLYCVTKYPQIGYPNTMMDKKLSVVEKTAMQLNDPMDLLSIPDEELDDGQQKAKRKLEYDKHIGERITTELETMFGANVTGDVSKVVDARKEISSQDWHDAVNRAKTRVVKHSKKAIPNASKIRSAVRKIRMRNKHEQNMNRQRRRR